MGRVVRMDKVAQTDRVALVATSPRVLTATPLSMNIQKILLLKILLLNPQAQMKMQL